MKIFKSELKLIIEQFLSEEDKSEDSAGVETDDDADDHGLDTLVVKQPGLSVELRDENGKHNVYVNGAIIDDPQVSHQKKSAIIAKAFKDIKFAVADGGADQSDAENILLWADVGIQGGRKSLVSTAKNAKHRLSVNWNSWVEELTSKF